MSKISNLDLALDEMITAGQKMIDAATALKEMFSEATPQPNSVASKVEAPAPESEVKTYSFQEVRGIMASLAGKGKKAEAKALLTKYGASRLSDVSDPTESLSYYSTEMQNCAEGYRDYVLEQYERSKKFCSDPMV